MPPKTAAVEDFDDDTDVGCAADGNSDRDEIGRRKKHAHPSYLTSSNLPSSIFPPCLPARPLARAQAQAEPHSKLRWKHSSA